MQSQNVPMLHPVPRSVAEWVRTIKTRPTINDMVEQYHLTLLADENYARLYDAVYNEQAVEGSLMSDDHEAARAIREAAIRDNSPLGREKLATIVKAARVVLRRYDMSRNQRRDYFGSSGPGPSQASAVNADAEDELS
jgi:hypothetical protein